MCGITMYIGSKMTLEKFKELTNLIKVRGPDNQQFLEYNNIYFGFNRLSINDTSELGNQPFETDNTILMCNGEIYNSNDLIKKYNLIVKGKSDCEVILHLYEQFGDISKVISLLDGVYSLVLHDKKKNKTFISRDRFGVRSLYIGQSKTELMIASEMKCLHDFDHVRQFPPNEFAEIEEINKIQFKQIKVNRPSIYSDNPSKMIKTLLNNAVKKRLHSDRPIGCLLSGGLDSSIIAYLLSMHVTQLNTYSIGLSKDSPDLKYARIVAKSIGSNHHEVILSELDFLEAIPNVIKIIESYDTTSVRASIPMYLLCKYIHKNSNDIVIFSGEGSDEMFGGYLYFHNAPDNVSFQTETQILLQNIHYFDGLRSDKCISSNGLEARIPFLDHILVNYVLNLDPNIKRHPTIEKYILRKAFENCLPDSVLWRKKEAFSDGCSEENNSWYSIIQNYVKTQKLENNEYTINPPQIPESLWYRQIFHSVYPNRDTVIPYYWLPKWNKGITDPSARVLSIYKKRN